MTDNPRIAQFKQMAEADPQNELGHMSLGKAYLEAEQFEQAVAPLARALELNSRLSKAYQLLGEAYDKSGKRDQAIEIMTRGVTSADQQGDRMPRDAMIAALTEWGAPVPALQAAPESASSGPKADPSAEGFVCARCARPSGRLAKPPFRGALGEKVFAHVCNTCWKEWVGMGTKVINELSLALSDPESQDTYDQYMVEFLQLEELVDPADAPP